MDYTGIALLIALFICNALSIDSIFNNKNKRAMIFNIAALCLTVALAYNFKQIEDIITVFLVVVVLVLAFFIARFVLKRKKAKKNEAIIEAEIENDIGEKNENN